MTCRACEVRVEKHLRKIPTVTGVKVSARTGTATVVSTRSLPSGAVRDAVGAAGYAVGGGSGPWLSRDRVVWRDVATAVAVLVAVFALAKLAGFDRLAVNLSDRATQGSLVFVVLLGVAASLSTCMALVGGMVLALSARFAERHQGASAAARLRPQLMFNLGRIVGFTLLGAIVGAIGSAVALSGTALALMMIVVAVVMGVLGIGLSGASPKMAGFKFALPPALTRRLRGNGASDSSDGTVAARPYRDIDALGLGAASFFLPCGFTQAVQVFALSTGSPVQAGVVMGLFALGTTPGLMGVGALASLASGKGAARVFRYVGVLVVAFAIVNLTGAITALAPGAFGSTPAVAASQRTDNVTDGVGDQSGYQVVHTTVSSAGYSPQNTVIYAGVPVKWELDVQSFTCATIINAEQMGLGQLRLETEKTTVEFTPKETGQLDYACAMGMVSGSFTVIDPPSNGVAVPGAATPKPAT